MKKEKRIQWLIAILSIAFLFFAFKCSSQYSQSMLRYPDKPDVITYLPIAPMNFINANDSSKSIVLNMLVDKFTNDSLSAIIMIQFPPKMINKGDWNLAFRFNDKWEEVKNPAWYANNYAYYYINKRMLKKFAEIDIDGFVFENKGDYLGVRIGYGYFKNFLQEVIE